MTNCKEVGVSNGLNKKSKIIKILQQLKAEKKKMCLRATQCLVILEMKSLKITEGRCTRLKRLLSDYKLSLLHIWLNSWGPFQYENNSINGMGLRPPRSVVSIGLFIDTN